jgi:hypothetical protein
MSYDTDPLDVAGLRYVLANERERTAGALRERDANHAELERTRELLRAARSSRAGDAEGRARAVAFHEAAGYIAGHGLLWFSLTDEEREGLADDVRALSRSPEAGAGEKEENHE